MLFEVIILPYLTLRAFCEDAILIFIGIELAGQLTSGMVVVFVESTKAVVLIDPTR